MRKKYLALLLCAILIASTAGCAAPEAGGSTAPAPTIQPTDHQEPESTNGSKELLPLEDYRSKPVSYDFEEGSILETKSIALPHTALQERSECLYSHEKDLDILVEYTKEVLHTEIDSRWKVFVHYYDADKTVGMVQFIYTVEEIETNRSILFNIHGSQYDMVYYKCLTEAFNEADLLDRVAIFKSRYVQGKKELQDGESFCQEQANFIYYIHADKLVYSYAYFFQYDMGVINNDWGTVRLIDENGCAIAIV